MSQALDLWDYRRSVETNYRAMRSGAAGVETWASWVLERDDLFRDHPQSPIDNQSSFTGLSYFVYSDKWRSTGRFTPVQDEAEFLTQSGTGATAFRRVGVVDFEVAGQTASLDVLWLDSYGGGIFLPFRDTTNGTTTYGGGRYLLDSAKGADLGHSGGSINLDFNYAYHPSCVYSPKWSCPLAPPANNLSFGVTAGERLDERLEDR